MRARFQKSELAFVKSVLTNHSMAYMFSGSQKAISFVKHLKKRASFFEKLASFLHTVVNEKASSLWKPARFLVKWSPEGDFHDTRQEFQWVVSSSLWLSCVAYGRIKLTHHSFRWRLSLIWAKLLPQPILINLMWSMLMRLVSIAIYFQSG